MSRPETGIISDSHWYCDICRSYSKGYETAQEAEEQLQAHINKVDEFDSHEAKLGRRRATQADIAQLAEASGSSPD